MYLLGLSHIFGRHDGIEKPIILPVWDIYWDDNTFHPSDFFENIIFYDYFSYDR